MKCVRNLTAEMECGGTPERGRMTLIAAYPCCGGRALIQASDKARETYRRVCRCGQSWLVYRGARRDHNVRVDTLVWEKNSKP